MESLESKDWELVHRSLDAQGYAVIKQVLTETECCELIDLYQKELLFRSTINMKRYRFGQGEYKYFRYPLPPLIAALRKEFYKPLKSIANEWMTRLGIEHRYPDEHAQFITWCHSKSQESPTPLILRYEAGGFNTLHQDMYGDVYFPLQVVLMLTQRGEDYEGGELAFVEQLPRAQSRVEVVTPGLGDAVIFTTNFRPVKGSRGYYRARIKHGISPVKSGLRYALGIIFHDAALN